MSSILESFLHRVNDGTNRGSSFIPAKNGIIHARKLPGTDFEYTNVAGKGDGSINVGLMNNKTVQVIGNRSAATSFIVQIECRVHEEMPWQITLTRTYTDSGSFGEFLPVSETVTFFRVGVKITGTGGANDWITTGFNARR